MSLKQQTPEIGVRLLMSSVRLLTNRKWLICNPNLFSKMQKGRSRKEVSWVRKSVSVLLKLGWETLYFDGMRIYKEDMNTRGWGLRWGSNYQFINYFPHLAWHRLPHFHSTLCKGCSKPTSPPIYAFTSTQIGKFRDQAGIAPDLFALFSSGGVNINEVVLRQGVGLVQMTKRHGIEFPEHSRHFDKKIS